MSRLQNAIGVSLLAATVAGCSLLDGPLGPIPGGPLRSGELVTEPDVDWSRVTEGINPLFLEFALLDPSGSRTTGAMVHDGQLYVPCDLGFIWSRVPAPQRWLLALIYYVKGWHEDAVEDGRVVLRVGGNRYERQAILVTDPALVRALRDAVEEGAADMLGAPLGELPPEGPRDIWFFRIEPRPPA